MTAFRLSAAGATLVVGYCWLWLLNGQFYTNALGGVGCCLAAAALGAWELACWRRPGWGRRAGALVLVGCALGLAALCAQDLPGKARRQEEFNRRHRERLLQREAGVPR